MSAAVAAALLVSLPLAAVHPAVPIALPGLFALVALVRNAALARFFRGRHGLVFAAAALFYHQLYYVYSSGVYVWCWLERRLTPGAGPRPIGLLLAGMQTQPASAASMACKRQEADRLHGKD